MQWEKKICIRITIRRIVGAILAASTVANIVIVGAVVGADPAPAAPTLTSTSITPLWTATFIIPNSGAEEAVSVTPAAELAFTPTETFVPTQTPVESPDWIVCVKRFYWPTYHVQAGDTLFAIASFSGSTVAELMQANCRTNDRLYIGELLHVPRLWSEPGTITPTPTASATPTPTGTETVTGTPTDTPTATPTDTLSPTPTDTPSPTPSITPTPTETIVLACDRAQFIADVTIPAGTYMPPGTTFTKTWRVMNVGTCAWTPSYQIVFFGGEQMGAPASQPLSQSVAVQQTVDISVRMTAPRSAGFYLGTWMLQNANGALFGVGPAFNEPLWLEITVYELAPTLTATPTNTPEIKITISPGAGPTLVSVP